MGEHTYHEIERVRAGSQFTSLEDFCHRIDPQSVNQSQIVNLIKSGAFDILEPNRNKLLERYERVLKNTRPSRGGSGKSGVQLLLFDPEMFEDDEKGEGGRREESIPPPDPVQIIGFEQESLGYCITHDAMDSYRELMAGLRAITPFQINPKLEGKTVHVVGYIDHADRDSPLIEEESELILDLEGTVLKASSFAASSYARVQESRHPLLIQAVVQRHKGAECHLVAQRFYSLEDVRRVCRQVRTLRLSLGGEDRKTIAALRSLIKMYQGNTDVELEGKALGWFTLRGIRNTKVLCCPPLYWGLLSILSEHRVVYLDQNGHPIAHLYS
jgi:DNA polymerase III alpha subunit